MAHMSPTCFIRIFAIPLLLLSMKAAAQVSIQPNDNQAKPVVAQGSVVSTLVATDKSVSRILVQLNASSKTAVITEVTQDEKNELQYLKVNTVQPSTLRPVGEFGSRIETEDNDYFGGKVHVVVLTCTGANVACVAEQDFETTSGQAAKRDTQTYFKAHFAALADAERMLADLMALR